MDQGGGFPRQGALRFALFRVAAGRRFEVEDGAALQEGEESQVVEGALVVGIDPELVELVGGGAPGVEPDGSRLGLAEFAAGGPGDQGVGQAMGLLSGAAPDEVGTGGDVPHWSEPPTCSSQLRVSKSCRKS